MPPPIQREWTIGENRVQFEPPDLLRVEFKGVCSLSEATEMVKVCRELASLQPFFLLGDMGDAGPVDAEARHYFGEHLRADWVRGLIYYRVRLLHKAVLMGLSLALEMTGQGHHPLRKKLHFTSTRDKAEALLAQLRSSPGAEESDLPPTRPPSGLDSP